MLPHKAAHFSSPEAHVNKGVPSLFVAVLAGVGMGLFLGRALTQITSTPAPVVPRPSFRPTKRGERLYRFLHAERN
jgi:hypothetical protein